MRRLTAAYQFIANFAFFLRCGYTWRQAWRTARNVL
jgi:hypothetical protein